jgi:lipoate-protein ligase A
MVETWRLLDTGPCPAAENMALDEAILTARSRNLVPNTLRFLQFRPRCTLVGYHQAVEQEIRVEYCHAHGIEVNRRITGGGALFWDESQLGWEIYAPVDHPHLPRRPDDLYACLCQSAVAGLERLGVRAAFRPKNDIEVDGRKISGTGGTEIDGAFLFQGTLLVDFDVDTMLRALRIPTEKLKDKEVASLRERVTCLAWELGYVPSLPPHRRFLRLPPAGGVRPGGVSEGRPGRPADDSRHRRGFLRHPGRADAWRHPRRRRARPPGGRGEAELWPPGSEPGRG